MEIITIEVRYGSMLVHHAKLPKSRLEWRASGLDVYVKGSLAGLAYEQAANIAMNYALSLHIPLISLRRQK